MNPRSVSRIDDVKFLNHPNATSEDLKDFINCTIRRKPDTIIIHIGTNDITGEIETISNLKGIGTNDITGEIDKISNLKVMLSSVLMRCDDPHIKEKVKKINAEIKLFCDENLMGYISNDRLGKVTTNKKAKANF